MLILLTPGKWEGSESIGKIDIKYEKDQIGGMGGPWGTVGSDMTLKLLEGDNGIVPFDSYRNGM